jgi:hypothetical protein
MAKKPSRTSALRANDDIGEELRLRMRRFTISTVPRCASRRRTSRFQPPMFWKMRFCQAWNGSLKQCDDPCRVDRAMMEEIDV